MGIKKALLAGTAVALLFLGAACRDDPAATPSATHTSTVVAPPPTPAIRPQDWAVVTEERPLHEAALSGSRADVEEALDQGADVNVTATVKIHTGQEVSGLTALHLASALNDDPEVAMLLLDRGADIRANDGFGHTPLHWAAGLNNNPDVVALLLDRGADIEAGIDGDWLSPSGITPLHLAAAGHGNNPEVAALLLDRGADIESEDEDGSTPLHYAARLKASQEMVALLLDRGADIKARDDSGGTPLHYAAGFNHKERSNNDKEIAALLLDRGANIDAEDDDGNTALHHAAGFNDKEMVALLLDRGADVAAENEDGNTPLHSAAAGPLSAKEVAALLLDRGADIQVKNDNGDTPCQLARTREEFRGTPVLGRLCAP